MAREYERVEVESRAQWRAWLAEHHDSSPGAWLVTFKKRAVPDRHVHYADTVEEALCFGWVDSLGRKLDERRSQLLMTPRKPKSNWSRPNKERVERLVAAGLMAPAGLAAVVVAKATERGRRSTPSRASPSPTTCAKHSTPMRKPAASGTPSLARSSAASSSGSSTPSAPRRAPGA